MSKFKVGDKVRCIAGVTHGAGWELGKEGTVKEITLDSKNIYWFNEFENGAFEDSLELVKDTPKPKFKAGDRVKTNMGEGIIVKCDERDMDSPYHIKYESGGTFWSGSDKAELIEEGCNSCEEDICRDNGEELDFISEDDFNEPSNSSRNKVGKIMSKVSEFVKNSLLSKEEKLLRKYGLKDSCGDYTDEAERLVIGKLVKENEAHLIEVALAMEAEEAKNK